mgnify:CR=1 FL=1
MKFRNICIYLVITLCSFSNSYSQNINSIGKQSKKQNTKFFVQKPGHIYTNFQQKDSIITEDIDYTEMVDIIIEFKETPMFLSMNSAGLMKPNYAKYQTLQSSLYNDIKKLHASAQNSFNTTFSLPRKKAEFYKIFCGAAFSVPRAILSGISSLPYVKRVLMDKKYSVNYGNNISYISADSVWKAYSNQGDSIKIAIIDSGIDYTHPDLGMGFGQGFKVYGGYDYVNKDDDPMDDNGHGTHVAGIVAADGSIVKGVAPKAFLYAIKVIDKNGYGYEDKIISGIERAADPNNDGSYDDKVDIANMSLGAYGDPNDALSTAVNNAVDLGIVFCISAGNDRNYKTINSPGCAEKAITVGSCDTLGNISDFSSRGPTNEVFSIKPDILAPGSNIYSTYLNKSYSILSGTSMASPHVAGVCALIKRQHKDWSPEMIKSAITTTAKDINYDVMAQGSGIVNAFKAINAPILTIPSSLSFGLDDNSKDVWIKTDTLIVINKSNKQQNYLSSINGCIPGTSIIANPASFSLTPGDSVQVIISLTVNNSITKDNANNNSSYSGNLSLTSAESNVSIPWAFAKTASITINFDVAGVSFMFVNENVRINSSNLPNFNTFLSKSCKFDLPQGKYDLWAQNSLADSSNSDIIVLNRFLYKKDVEVKNNSVFNIKFSDCIYDLNINSVDESGKAMTTYSDLTKCFILMNTDDTTGLKMFWYSNNTIKFKSSLLPDNISIHAFQFMKSQNRLKKLMVLQFPPVKGLSNDIAFTNKATDYLEQNIDLNLCPFSSKFGANFQVVTSCIDQNKTVSEKKNVTLSKQADYYDVITTMNWQGKLYMIPPPSKNVNMGIDLNTNVFGVNNWFDINPIYIIADTFRLCYDDYDNGITYYSHPSPNKGTITLGDGVIFPNSQYRIFRNGNDFYFNGYTYPFYGQSGEFRFGDLNYATFSFRSSNNAIIDSGLINKTSGYIISKGKYIFTVYNNHYTVGGYFGKSTYAISFNTDINYPIPYISNLQILDCLSNPTNKLDPNDKAEIKISTTDLDDGKLNSSGNIDVYIKKSDQTEWAKIKMTKSDITNGNFLFKTSDLHSFDKAYVDMKLIVQNSEGTKIEYLLQPAFTVGTCLSPQVIDSIKTTKGLTDYHVSNNYPNPFNPQTTIKYTLPYTSKVQITIYDILGREVKKLVDEVEDEGNYTVNFNAGNLSSGIYFYSFRANSYTQIKKMLLLK